MKILVYVVVLIIVLIVLLIVSYKEGGFKHMIGESIIVVIAVFVSVILMRLLDKLIMMLERV